MSRKLSLTAALMGCTTFTLALPIDLGTFPWALLAVHVWWLLPDWIRKWRDVRDC